MRPDKFKTFWGGGLLLSLCLSGCGGGPGNMTALDAANAARRNAERALRASKLETSVSRLRKNKNEAREAAEKANCAAKKITASPQGAAELTAAIDDVKEKKEEIDKKREAAQDKEAFAVVAARLTELGQLASELQGLAEKASQLEGFASTKEEWSTLETEAEALKEASETGAEWNELAAYAQEVLNDAQKIVKELSPLAALAANLPTVDKKSKREKTVGQLKLLATEADSLQKKAAAGATALETLGASADSLKKLVLKAKTKSAPEANGQDQGVQSWRTELEGKIDAFINSVQDLVKKLEQLSESSKTLAALAEGAQKEKSLTSKKLEPTIKAADVARAEDTQTLDALGTALTPIKETLSKKAETEAKKATETTKAKKATGITLPLVPESEKLANAAAAAAAAIAAAEAAKVASDEARAIWVRRGPVGRIESILSQDYSFELAAGFVVAKGRFEAVGSELSWDEAKSTLTGLSIRAGVGPRFSGFVPLLEFAYSSRSERGAAGMRMLGSRAFSDWRVGLAPRIDFRGWGAVYSLGAYGGASFIERGTLRKEKEADKYVAFPTRTGTYGGLLLGYQRSFPVAQLSTTDLERLKARRLRQAVEGYRMACPAERQGEDDCKRYARDVENALAALESELQCEKPQLTDTEKAENKLEVDTSDRIVRYSNCHAAKQERPVRAILFGGEVRVGAGHSPHITYLPEATFHLIVRM